MALLTFDNDIEVVPISILKRANKKYLTLANGFLGNLEEILKMLYSPKASERLTFDLDGVNGRIHINYAIQNKFGRIYLGGELESDMPDLDNDFAFITASIWLTTVALAAYTNSGVEIGIVFPDSAMVFLISELPWPRGYIASKAEVREVNKFSIKLDRKNALVSFEYGSFFPHICPYKMFVDNDNKMVIHLSSNYISHDSVVNTKGKHLLTSVDEAVIDDAFIENCVKTSQELGLADKLKKTPNISVTFDGLEVYIDRERNAIIDYSFYKVYVIVDNPADSLQNIMVRLSPLLNMLILTLEGQKYRMVIYTQNLWTPKEQLDSQVESAQLLLKEEWIDYKR